MKKINMVLAAGLCLALSTSQKAFSQTSVPFQLAVASLTASSSDEAVAPPIVSEATVNNKAVLHFHASYPAASESRWSTTSDGAVVRFVSSGMTIYQTFDRKGRWTGTLRNLGNDQIPAGVVKRVKSLYPDFTISFAQDIRTPYGFIHIIKIDSDRELKTLTVTNDSINVIEEFSR